MAAACYPYCMAARLRDSGANGLVLYNANEWRDRVHLMHRYCNKQQTSDPLLAVREGGAQSLMNGTTARSQHGTMNVKQLKGLKSSAEVSRLQVV